METHTETRPGPSTRLLPDRHPGRRRWRAVWQVAIVAAAVVLAWRLLRQLGWSEVLGQARDVSWALVVAVVVCLIGRFVLVYLRWSRVLRLLDLPAAHLFAFTTLLAAVLANHLTPTARVLGGVLRARYLALRHALSFAAVYGTVLVDQISHHLVHAPVTWLALGLFFWIVGWHALGALLIVLLLATILVLSVWRRGRGDSRHRSFAGLLKEKAARSGRRIGPLFAGGQKVADLLERAFSDVGLQTSMASFSFGVLLLNAAALWLTCLALHVEVTFVQALLASVVGIGAGIVTGTPGGIATTEAAMIAALVALGASRVDAASATLLYRGLHYLVVLGLGLPALVYCELLGAWHRGASAGSRPEPAAPPDSGEPGRGYPTDSSA